jgi:hypothetical protein
MQAATFDVGELMDEATTLLLSASLDGQRTSLLIGKLRTCANHTNGDGNGGVVQKLRALADQLEQRMLGP